MSIKEYLSQARYLDMRIQSKLEQLESLNELATKCTSVITGMPHSPSKNTSSMADTINKIIDLQCEINKDIDNLVDLKEEISQVIAGVEQTDLRMILEKRYLCFHSWEKIASEMFYDLRWLHRLHSRALESAGKVYDKIQSDH